MATIKTQLQTRHNNSDSLQDKTVLKKGEPFYNSPTGDFYIGDGFTSLPNIMPINVAQLVADHKLQNNRHEFIINATIGDKKFFYIISYLTADYGGVDSVAIKVKNIRDDSYITYTGTLNSLYFNSLDSNAFVSQTVNMFLVLLPQTGTSGAEIFVNNVMDNATTVLIPPFIAQEGNQIVWNKVNDATSYTIYDNGALSTVTGEQLSYTFTPNVNHELKVKANAEGYNSDWSNVVNYTMPTETYTILWNNGIVREIDDEEESTTWSVVNEEVYFNFTSNNSNFIGIAASEEELFYIQPNYRYLSVYEGSGECRGWDYISRAYQTITLTQNPYDIFTGDWAYFLRYNSAYQEL